MTDREKLFDLMMRDPCPYSAHCSAACKYYKSQHCHAERYADHLIANGVTVQEWISVKDRLPEEDGYYLCYVESFVFQGSHFITLLNFYVGEGFGDVVTHWMPLPEPPKGE